jgi:hypothetical protein
VDVVAIESGNVGWFIDPEFTRDVLVPPSVFLLLVPNTVKQLEKNLIAGPNYATAPDAVSVFPQPRSDGVGFGFDIENGSQVEMSSEPVR